MLSSGAACFVPMATPRLVGFFAIVVAMFVCGARGELSATMEINLDSNWYTSNSNGTFFSVPGRCIHWGLCVVPC